MDHSAIMGSLSRAGGFFETYHQIAVYTGYRQFKNGGVREVTIRIFDKCTPEATRYHIIATDSDGRVATGNPAESIEATIALVHWGDLDEDPPPR